MNPIRCSDENDLPAICRVNRAAFGDEEGPEIVELVRNLIVDETAKPVLSLVAQADGAIIGHVLFSAVRVQDPQAETSARILAPLAVAPSHQGAGVGGALVRDGLRRLCECGVDLVFVLGHPGYYPRFGFVPAAAHGLTAPYPIPDAHMDAWMVQVSSPGPLGRTRGQITCARTLSRPEYW